jgi:hypothetical protein
MINMRLASRAAVTAPQGELAAGFSSPGPAMTMPIGNLRHLESAFEPADDATHDRYDYFLQSVSRIYVEAQSVLIARGLVAPALLGCR